MSFDLFFAAGPRLLQKGHPIRLYPGHPGLYLSGQHQHHAKWLLAIWSAPFSPASRSLLFDSWRRLCLCRQAVHLLCPFDPGSNKILWSSFELPKTGLGRRDVEVMAVSNPGESP